MKDHHFHFGISVFLLQPRIRSEFQMWWKSATSLVYHLPTALYRIPRSLEFLFQIVQSNEEGSIAICLPGIWLVERIFLETVGKLSKTSWVTCHMDGGLWHGELWRVRIPVMIRAPLPGVQLHRVCEGRRAPGPEPGDLGAAPSWASPSSSLCLTFLICTMTPALSCQLCFEDMVRFDTMTRERVAGGVPCGS